MILKYFSGVHIWKVNVVLQQIYFQENVFKIELEVLASDVKVTWNKNKELINTSYNFLLKGVSFYLLKAYYKINFLKSVCIIEYQ